MPETEWALESLDNLRQDFCDVYEVRAVPVTGADGFMRSRSADALVE